MLSTFHGIEVGKKGIMANNAGIENIGHNLSNIETPGYSRQKINLTTFPPLFEPSANRVETAGQIGAGVIVEDIQRVRDQTIDDRINYENGGLGFWKTREDFLHQIELIINEPNSPNLRTVLDEYWESWHKLSLDPLERASREELIQRTKSLTTTFNHYFNSLYNLRQNINMLVEQRINEINHIAEEIANLNLQIIKSEALGDNPNDLYDKRDLLVEKLSKYVDIRVERINKKELVVYIGTENLVQGGKVNKIYGIGNTANDGFVDVRWGDGRKVKLGGGELAGLISVRDVDLKNIINELDALAINIIDATNEIHKDGFGLNLSTDINYFTQFSITPYANGNYDFNNDGNIDGTAIFKVSGINEINPDSIIGSSGYLNFGPAYPGGNDVIISYNANDKIKDIIEKINKSDANVVAYLNHKNQLSFKAKLPVDDRYPYFVIRHIEDSGNFLVGIAGLLANSGPNGAFDYRTINDITKFNVPHNNISLTPEKHPSGWISINETIVQNPDNIAAAGGYDFNGSGNPNRVNGLADNRNALLIAELRHKKIMIESQSTIGDFFKSIVGKLGTQSETAKINSDKNKTVVETLENLREQISGVNIDEELTKMLMFQHGYNASARLVSTIDRMIETIIKMGA